MRLCGKRRCWGVLLFLLVPVMLLSRSEAGETSESVLIELDGTGSSDNDGDELRYFWRQVEGPNVRLSDARAAKPYFRTSRPGLYAFELIVFDGKRKSRPARVEVNVERQNISPEARVPENMSASVGDEIVIDGSLSRDADGQELQYLWRQTGGPPLYLQPEMLGGSRLPVRLREPGVYELELVVSDGIERSAPARCRLVVRPENTAPVARAVAVGRAVLDRSADVRTVKALAAKPVAVIGGTEFAQVGEEVVLDGRGSTSPSGKPLRYYWKQRSGPFIRSFKRSDDNLLRFNPEETGRYIFELVVSDGKSDSVPVTREVRVTQTNEPPIAVVESASFAAVGAMVKLDGSGSFDREGAKLKYTWKQVSGPRVLKYHMLDPRGEVVPSFRPSVPGRYVFELIVNDGQTDSRPARATINVQQSNRPPVARTGGDLTISPGECAVLQGAATDPDGDEVTYVWRQTSGPELLKRPSSQQSLNVTPKEEGVYAFELIASDGKARSEPVKCRVRVQGAGVIPDSAPVVSRTRSTVEGPDLLPDSTALVSTVRSKPSRNIKQEAFQPLVPAKKSLQPKRFHQRPVARKGIEIAPMADIEFDAGISTAAPGSWTDE